MRRLPLLTLALVLVCVLACRGRSGTEALHGPHDSHRHHGPSGDAAAHAHPGSGTKSGGSNDGGVQEPPPRAPEGTRGALSGAGGYRVSWRPTGGQVPRNEHFSIEAWLWRGDEPLPGAKLRVSAWMPDHGHGMLTDPQTLDRGEGRYEVEGVLLHMRGHWQLFFDVIDDGHSERVEFELDL